MDFIVSSEIFKIQVTVQAANGSAALLAAQEMLPRWAAKAEDLLVRESLIGPLLGHERHS